VAFGPDGRSLVSGGGGDGDLNLCALNAGGPVEVRAFRGSGKVVHAVAFTPDGQALVTADDGGHVACLDVAGGRVRYEGKLAGPVYGLSLAGDGRHLATANHDGTVSVLRLPPPAR
jgi:WD40 repeat protein